MNNLKFGIEKRKAVARGRRISNATISLILSSIVTVAAQSERMNQGGRILRPAAVAKTPTPFDTSEDKASLRVWKIQ